MNLMGVLKMVGTGLLASTPLGAAALPVINSFLPDDKKLDESSTGADAQSAVDALPPAARENLMLANITLETEKVKGRTARYEAMCAADGQETRAKMVMRAMNTLIALSLIFLAFVGWVYVTKGATVAANPAMVALFLSIVGPFAYVVRAYFGDLKSETQSRHATVDDKAHPLKGLGAVIAAIKG